MLGCLTYVCGDHLDDDGDHLDGGFDHLDGGHGQYNVDHHVNSDYHHLYGNLMVFIVMVLIIMIVCDQRDVGYDFHDVGDM